MIYDEWLKKNKDFCPFCNLKKEEILKQNKSFYLVLARAPYIKDHLLIVPKKHKTRISELTNEEFKLMNKLLFYSFKKLNKVYEDVSILYREGDKETINKSIDHMHIHLIPKIKIGSIRYDKTPRKRFEDEEYIREIQKAKKKLF